MHKKWSFPLRISSVNVATFIEEILNGKLHFLRSGIFFVTGRLSLLSKKMWLDSKPRPRCLWEVFAIVFPDIAPSFQKNFFHCFRWHIISSLEILLSFITSFVTFFRPAVTILIGIIFVRIWKQYVLIRLSWRRIF